MLANTIVMEHASFINGRVCFSLGLPLNVLLIWMVAFRSPEELRVYRKVLLFTAAVDLTLLSLSFAVQPVIFVTSGEMQMYGLGPIMRLGYEPVDQMWNAYWGVSWVGMIALAHYAVPLPFLFRYALLCRDKELSLRTYLLLFAIATLVAVAVVIPLLIFNAPNDQNQVAAEHRLFGGANRAIGAVDVLVAIDCAYLACLTLAYSLMVVLCVKIWRYLRHTFTAVSRVNALAKEMNHQINVVLLLQAIIPFVTEVLPGSYLWFSFVLSLPARYGSYIAAMIFNWMPVINPLMPLLFIRPYRNAIVGAINHPFPCIRKRRLRRIVSFTGNYHACYGGGKGGQDGQATMAGMKPAV